MKLDENLASGLNTCLDDAQNPLVELGMEISITKPAFNVGDEFTQEHLETLESAKEKLAEFNEWLGDIITAIEKETPPETE